ncbi:unnamed protein product [Blepharisma stoltei]|uniref:Amidohydrolase-related domain-containing protein n=1 Tax=Blepharisma stoltei TaxID=1481888 RepID=A0AAU9KBC6_9CILI|nr:unnamed protein product [Blepharisma stoltei]
MVKKSIISKHIIHYSYREPVYGIILIEDEDIKSIQIFDETVNIDAVISRYQSWNPMNFGDFYISPGIIDIGIRPEFENLQNTSRMAASGGVTFFLEEKPLYNEEITENHSDLCCDIGSLLRIDDEKCNIDELKQKSHPFAIKAYLSQPSAIVNAVSDLPSLFFKAQKTGLPLILDPSLPNQRMLYMASPCRFLRINERISQDTSKDLRYLAAAFPDSIDSESDDDEITLNFENKNRRRASEPLVPIFQEDGQPVKRMKVEDKVNYSLDESAIEKIESPNMIIENSSPEQSTVNSIEYRIKVIEESIENLSKAEQLSYQNSGITSYTDPQRRRSVSVCYFNTNSAEEAESPAKKRLEGFRPNPLILSTDSSPHNDDLYIVYIANIPDKWEIAGVDKILQAFSTQKCKLHIANLSSASSVNKIRHAKLPATFFSCDTASSYLCFNDQDIGKGDTRFKDFPPIRTKANSDLLWDLLKLKDIKMISSHHASIPNRYKQLDSGSFRKSLSGVNNLGFNLQSIWTHLMKKPNLEPLRERYLVNMSKWLSLYPAQLLGIDTKRGSISIGQHADLIIWKPYEATTGKSYSEYKETCIYQNSSLYGKISKVMIRGKFVYNEGTFYPNGRFVNNA